MKLAILPVFYHRLYTYGYTALAWKPIGRIINGSSSFFWLTAYYVPDRPSITSLLTWLWGYLQLPRKFIIA